MASPDERQEPVTDEFDDDIHEVPSHTPDFRTELAEELARLLPEAVADGKIDVEKLRELLDEDAANDGRERYGLMWPGKARALKAAQAPTTATLVPDRENSKDWDTTQNVFIEGDNLEVLKILQKHYHGKIKLIYIDPPYNTGNDFIYPDNYREGLQTYLEWTKQVAEDGKKLSSNPESAGRYHSNWLNMMYPRLKLARNLLSEDGMIAVSIDDVEQAGLVQVIREVFGESNFLANVARVSKKTSNKGTHFAPSKDFLVLAAKDVNALPPLMAPVPQEYRDRFGEKDERGSFATVGLYQASLDPMRGCSNQRYWIEAPDGSFVIPPGPNVPEDIGDGVNRPPENRHDKVWRWSYSSYLQQKDLLVFKKTKNSPLRTHEGKQAEWNVYTKYYLEDRLENGIRPRDYISELTNDLGTKALISLDLGQYFDFSKPPQLVSVLLTWINDPNALILDFFAGSAATAQAVMEMNATDGGSRRHIQIQLPEPIESNSAAADAGYRTISDISRERIRRAGDQIQSETALQASNLDLGFRAYKLADTNFVKWRVSNGVEQNLLEERLAGLRGSADDDATPEVLLTELLLKQGYSLTESMSETEIAGLKVWSVADGAMLAIMDEHAKPSLEQLRAVVEAGPVRLVILEDVFAGDDQLKTNLVQHAKTHGVELWSA